MTAFFVMCLETYSAPLFLYFFRLYYTFSSQDGLLPIHYAAQNGRCDVIEFLYECDPSAFSAVSRVWFFNFYVCCVFDIDVCVKIRVPKHITHILSLHLLYHCQNGAYPVKLAVERGYFDAARLLLELEPTTLPPLDKEVCFSFLL